MTMKTLALAALLGAATLLGQAGHCLGAWCPSYRCYARCNSQCACVTIGGGQGGTCVSIQALPDMLVAGWKELK